MRWQLKCILDSTKALMPYADELRKIKYSLFSYAEDAGRDTWTIREGLRQID